MFKYQSWVNMNYGWGDTQTDKHTDRHSDRHIITMTLPGLGAGPSETWLRQRNTETLKKYKYTGS